MDSNCTDKNFNRKEKVYHELRQRTEKMNIVQMDTIGFDAYTIGKAVGVDRSNTSKELNNLYKEKKIIKIKGKPVLYVELSAIVNSLGFSLNKISFASVAEFKECILNICKPEVVDFISDKECKRNDKKTQTIPKAERINGNIFESIIGWNKSLMNQVKLAKATILYPPNGLHTLILGSTGTGKSTFAEYMYKFAVNMNVFQEGASFITFNCADYFENPQLLISQIFGYCKGAFTGADKEKYGLIDAANNGVLFLDEIHRLPPEGQEMLFLLMDKGIYRRLGETDTNRKAKVLIIAATTEEPKSVMLGTFLRRIPAIIDLPSLENRSLEERMQLIYQFFWEESNRIGTKIKVSKEALMAFMYYDCPGNIGQLKSDIKLICAKAFLDYLSSGKELMEVKLSHLSSSVQKGIFLLRNKRYVSNGDHFLIKDDITFDGNEQIFKKFIVNNFSTVIEDKDYYKNIINNWDEYSSQGLSEKDIRDKIRNELEQYFQYSAKNNYKEVMVSNTILSEIVGPKILEAVESILNSVKEMYDESISDKVAYGLALHVNNLFERLHSGNVITHPNKINIQNEYPKEYEIAKVIKNLLEEKLQIAIPDDEAAFIAMLLYAIKTAKHHKNVGILVICHGKSVASSMCEVVNTLLGVDHARSIDMPLDESVEVILKKATDAVKECNRGKGVLLLVDMGSLVNFSGIITENTGITTKSFDKVNTLMLIEATRKAMLNINLDQLVQEIQNVFQDDIPNNEHRVLDLSIKDEEYLRNNLIDILNQTLTFLNPYKIFDTLYTTLEDITKQMQKEMSNDLFIKFLFHCSCMVERVIKNESLSYKKINQLMKSKENDLLFVKMKFKVVEETFNIEIDLEELAYVLEILDTLL